MNNKLFILFLLSTTLLSCQKEYTKHDCEELSLKSYRGFPKAAHDFKTHCMKYKIKYTAAKCQDAFNKLMQGASIDSLIKSHGTKIPQCFSEAELKKYSGD